MTTLRSLLKVCLFLGWAVTASTAWAQPWDGMPSGDYSSSGSLEDPYMSGPIIEANQVNDCVDWGPLNGIFFRYDAVYLLLTPPPTTVVGDPTLTYTLPVPGGGTVDVGSSLDTSWIDPGDWGDRFEFGWNGPDAGCLIGVLNVTQRDVLVSESPIVVFDPANFFPITSPQFDLLEQRATTTLTGVEAMASFFMPSIYDRGQLEFFGGARYLRVRDQFGLTGTGGDFDTTFIESTVDNHLIGPQVGMRWLTSYGFMGLVAEVRGMSAYNRQRARLFGQVASASSFANSVTTAFEREEFSPLAEWRTELNFQLIDGLSLRLGYTGMYMGGISRAAPKIDYTVPTIGHLSRSNDTGLFANGFTIGVVCQF